MVTVLLSALLAAGQVDLPAARPVPRMQVLPLPERQASVTRDGAEISRYYFGADLYRPFLYPLVGPSGKSLTRMGHPRDPNGHSHHNSFWVSHHDVGGVAFWNDAKTSTGRISHQRVTRYEDTDDEALIEVVNHWINSAPSFNPEPKATGTAKAAAAREKIVLEETRAMRFRPQSGGQWLLVLDLTFAAPQQPVTLGKTNFGFTGVRMAKTIGVHDGGGMIRNSEGAVNEPQVHEKPARWVDYSGQITPAAREGITLLDHPQNSNHPTVFHVRDDGWMGAAFNFAAPYTIEPGKPLKLRYGLWVHAGVPTPAAIDEQFAQFAKISDPPPVKK
jgi:hypothetical protein